MSDAVITAPALPGDIDRYVALFRLEERNAEARRVIARYAAGHAAMDVAIGIAGLFLPGGGLAATAASLLAQAPVIYQPMTRDLAGIYGASPDAFTHGMVTEAVQLGALGDLASELGMVLQILLGIQENLRIMLLQNLGQHVRIKNNSTHQ